MTKFWASLSHCLKTPISLDLIEIFAKTQWENDPYEPTHLFYAVTFDEGQRTRSLILISINEILKISDIILFKVAKK
jgi:hypothetical protein